MKALEELKDRLRATVVLCFLLLSLEVAFAERPTRVACVGDSITYGFGIGSREEKSYPAQLQGLLGDPWIVGNFGKNGATVLKKGHAPYWKAPQYRAALKFQPDVVIIALGTNDSRPENIGKQRENFVPDYLDLIRSFRSLESKPVVWICRPVPIYVTRKGMTDAVLRNEIIPLVDEVAKQAGIEVIDFYKVLSHRKEMFPDGVHPDAAGAGRIAEAVVAAITKEDR